ncbi:MAG: glycosyltransferase [Oscillospiraceae bacterium]|nr:glycosyltransferase [Oscillospiraceae bacterium]
MKLSICIIMKNSEGILRECLDSIKDILNRDDTELVVVDTGSHDLSKSIVSEYNGKIFDFTWEDDFSAARNFCMEKASGEWIFFIDTDEVLENPKSLCDFIDNTVSEEYAFTAVRQYSAGEKSEYTDIFPVRLFKKSDKKYKNLVYEVISGLSGNGISTDIVIRHNGRFSPEKFKKYDLILNSVYPDNSDDIRLNEMMMKNRSVKRETLKMKEYGEKAISLAESDENNKNILAAVISALIGEYTEHQNYYNAELLIKKYISLFKEPSVYDLPVYSSYIKILHDIMRYDETDDIYNRYVLLFGMYKKGELGGICDLLKLSGHSDASFRLNTVRYVNSLIGRELYDKAWDMLDNRLPLSDYSEDCSDFEERVRCEIKLIGKSGEFDKFPDRLSKFMGVSRKKTINTVDLIYKDISEDISNEFAALYEAKSDGSYESLLKLRYADLENKELDDETAFSFISAAISVCDEAKDILYYILKYKYPLNEWTDKLDTFEIPERLIILPSYGYKNIPEAVEDYIDSLDELASLQDMIAVSKFYEFMFERIDPNNIDNDKATDMFSVYVSVMTQYTEVMYKQEVINDEGIYSLPSNVVFAYFGNKALNERYAGNISAYLANLNKAVGAKKSFNPIIMVFLKGAKELLELTEQYKKIKLLINHTINSGNINEAYQYLNEYARMNPNDPELEMLVDKLEEAAK